MNDSDLNLFEKMLHDLYAQLQQFLSTLEAEKALLESNQTDALDDSLAAKRVVIESLDQLTAQCHSFFERFASAFNENSVLRMVAQFPTNKQLYLVELWNEIKNLLKACDKKNLINGVMITTLKNHNDNLLTILTNRPKETVYGNQYKKSQLAVSTQEHKA